MSASPREFGGLVMWPRIEPHRLLVSARMRYAGSLKTIAAGKIESMSLVLDLPADLESDLDAEAKRHGLGLQEYVLRILASGRTPGVLPKSGAELVAYGQAEGLIGTRPDVDDAPGYARRMRENAQNRTQP